MTGAAHYEKYLVNATPAIVAVEEVMIRTGKDFTWLKVLVSIGALCG
jgi:APA family basic amino acid/polyamine antiporter